jgi:ABC-type Zn uptake system ZnuABC Zn-binding protein ZnuA
VATTTIVGDVVRSIAGDAVDVEVLLPVNADPHAFAPTPADLIAVARADILFLSGAGLERDLEPLLDNANGVVVDLADPLDLRHVDAHEAGEGSAQEEDGGVGHDHHREVDPHVWLDPANVAVWAGIIGAELGRVDSAGAPLYALNAAAYRDALSALDRWIWDQIERIPVEDRRLVSDHLAFGYFAARYGFEQVGSVFPGFSSMAAPSARELAVLIESIEALEVRAIFVGTTVNPALAETIARDAGIAVVPLYTGSLSGPEGPASTYLDMMRYDVTAIVNALLR